MKANEPERGGKKIRTQANRGGNSFTATDRAAELTIKTKNGGVVIGFCARALIIYFGDFGL